MLTDISNHVTNFRALDNVVKKPEVAVDYRDLDYESKLDFVDDVELSLKNTKEVLDRCKSLIEKVENEYNSITDKEQAGAEISSLNKQLREGEDLTVILQQEAEVKKTLLDLKDRRKRFLDCNVQSTLDARSQIMTRIHSMFDSTQAKFIANKTNIDGLLSLDSTKPARKKILEECKANEIVEYEEKISKFDGIWKKMNQTYDSLSNEIGDYGELLRDVELKVNVDFIERLGTMQQKLTNLRHAVSDMDSAIDLMRVKIGELDVNQATQDYLSQKDEVIKQYTSLNTKSNLLLTYAKECEDYASDREEKELAETTHSGISSFLKTVSMKQTLVVDEKLVMLQKMNQAFALAMNKDEVKEGAFAIIKDLEKMFARMDETVEKGWNSLQKKYLHFSDFDLSHKREKRSNRHAKCETLTVQIKDNVASLLSTILEKLDSNVSKVDKESLKQIQV